MSEDEAGAGDARVQENTLPTARSRLSRDQLDKLDGVGSLDVSLASIEAFVIAASHTSLAEAARSCGLKEDTLRKRLDALEKWADVALLQRRPDIILTPDGMRFLPYARRACESVREFLSTPSPERLRNLIVGEIRKPKAGSLRRRNPPSGSYIEID